MIRMAPEASMKTYIFGLGTGRCGTQSLSRLLDSQTDSMITHEYGEILPWTIKTDRLDRKLQIISERGGVLVGDVASYYLPYVNHIIDKTHNRVKFIILKRDADEVCDSFMKKTSGRDHWRTGHGRPCRWDVAFPKFNDAQDKRDAIRKYCDMYYEMCENIPDELKYTINMTDLNVPTRCLQMLSWLRVEQPVYKKIHTNKNLQ